MRSQSKQFWSLVLPINPLHAGQNRLLSPVRFSEERNLSKDKEMDLANGNGIASNVMTTASVTCC